MVLLSFADFFSKLTFSKNSFRNTIRVSNGFDPDQDRRSVTGKFVHSLQAYFIQINPLGLGVECWLKAQST